MPFSMLPYLHHFPSIFLILILLIPFVSPLILHPSVPLLLRCLLTSFITLPPPHIRLSLNTNASVGGEGGPRAFFTVFLLRMCEGVYAPRHDGTGWGVAHHFVCAMSSMLIE